MCLSPTAQNCRPSQQSSCAAAGPCCGEFPSSRITGADNSCDRAAWTSRRLRQCSSGHFGGPRALVEPALPPPPTGKGERRPASRWPRQQAVHLNPNFRAESSQLSYPTLAHLANRAVAIRAIQESLAVPVRVAQVPPTTTGNGCNASHRAPSPRGLVHRRWGRHHFTSP